MKTILLTIATCFAALFGGGLLLAILSTSTREQAYTAPATLQMSAIDYCLVHSLRRGQDYQAAFRRVEIEGSNYHFELYQLGDVMSQHVRVPKADYALVGCRIY